MIPIALPVLDADEANAAREAVLSGWVSQGPQVAAFEEEFAQLVGAPYACAVSNCTTALHLALRVIGIRPGEEVITVSHSFIATANCISYCGATPVFVDIDPETYNIDPDGVAAAITRQTRAIVAVHQLGMPCDLVALAAIAKRHGLPLIEDAACAAGSEICINGRWQRIGKPYGDIACFSFHPRKVITTGEGGMLTTANPEYARKFKLLRQHGMTVPDTVRHSSTQVVFEGYSEVGFNYRMTDIQAAIGRRQLKRLPGIVTRRRQIAARYAELLKGIEGLSAPNEPAWARSNWQSYCVRLSPGLDQKTVMQAMLDKRVSTRRGIMCAHREGAYAHLRPRFSLRHSEAAQDHTILLPLYAQMSDDELDRVMQALTHEVREMALAE